MEAAFGNLLECGDKVIVCQNGVFGGRMKETSSAVAPIRDGDGSLGRSIDPKPKPRSKKPGCQGCSFCTCRDLTGVRSDAETLCRLAKEAGMLVIMDVVTSLAGIDSRPMSGVPMCTPGLKNAYRVCLAFRPSPSVKTLLPRFRRESTKQSWFLMANLIMGYWGEGAKRSYHHTAPVNAVYAIHEALITEEEGLEASIARHKANHEKLPLAYRSLCSSLRG